MEAKEVAQRQMYRRRLLEAIYDITKGARNLRVALSKVGMDLCIPSEEVRLAWSYLVKDHLLEAAGAGSDLWVFMTKEGCDEAERFVMIRAEQGLKLLCAMYRLTGGSTTLSIDGNAQKQCAKSAGLAEEDAHVAYQWLSDNGLLVQKESGHKSLSPEGVREAENSMNHPNNETEHFPRHVVQNVSHHYEIHAPVGLIQSGSHNIGHVVQNVADKEDVKKAIAQLRQAAETLNGEDREEAIALVDGIEKQVESPKPSKAMIKAAGDSLKDKLKVKEIDVVGILSVIMNFVKLIIGVPR